MKSPQLSILIVGSTYPLTEDDPQVPWLRESVSRLRNRGHDVTVLAPSYRGHRSHLIDGVYVKRFRYAPAVLEDLTHGSGAPNKIRSPFKKLLALPYLLAGCCAALMMGAGRKFDVIQIHWPFPHGFMGILAAFPHSSRLVMTCHGAELALGRKSALIRLCLRYVMSLADHLTCNSSHTRNEIHKILKKEVQVIPYGTTVEDKVVLTPRLSSRRKIKLLNCGRLIQRKGLSWLIQAMPPLLEKYDLELHITGEGDHKDKWMQEAKELGLLDSRIFFRGFVSNQELAELYQTCDIYVHPSIYDDQGDTEGLGVVLVEALMHAKPVIASKVGGIVDVIVDQKSGLLVPEKDTAALVEKISWLIQNPDKAAELGQGGLEYARQVFDWERITNETERALRG